MGGTRAIDVPLSAGSELVGLPKRVSDWMFHESEKVFHESFLVASIWVFLSGLRKTQIWSVRSNSYSEFFEFPISLLSD